MRVALAVIICRLFKFIGKMMGRGSSLPGKLALKVFPSVLSKIKLPKNVIAVTGSNGKTSTVEMIAQILQKAGKNVAYNKEGSNQIEGVATLILSLCTLGGKMSGDVLLLESDERYAKYTFKHFAPTHYVITNLYRDQLTRNGHPEWVFSAVNQSICRESTLVLNADDPLVSLFGHERENCVWFGIEEQSDSEKAVKGMYNDAFFCPLCHDALSYDYVHFNHIGGFNCKNCDYKKQTPDYSVSKTDFENSKIVINNKFEIGLFQKSLYTVYNLLAAFSVCSLIGIGEDIISESLNNYVLKNGRIIEFSLGERFGTLLTAKHENSVSYDQSLSVVSNNKSPCDVLIIVDAVSRKYFTSETSWLWDIDFGILSAENVNEIILSGTYCNDLALRFDYTEIEKSRIKVMQNIPETVEYLKKGKNHLFVITCFSDKDKLLKHTNSSEQTQ